MNKKQPDFDDKNFERKVGFQDDGQENIILVIPASFKGKVILLQAGQILYESTLPTQTTQGAKDADSGNPNPPPPPPPGH